VNGRILPYPMTPVEAQGGSSNSQGSSSSSIREAPGRQQQLREPPALRVATGSRAGGGNGHREAKSGGGDGDGRREGDSGALVMAALR
jgi:hypothetical protein